MRAIAAAAYVSVKSSGSSVWQSLRRMMGRKLVLCTATGVVLVDGQVPIAVQRFDDGYYRAAAGLMCKLFASAIEFPLLQYPRF
jgi:hypothetical protein